jgi:hypothetical protein
LALMDPEPLAWRKKAAGALKRVFPLAGTGFLRAVVRTISLCLEAVAHLARALTRIQDTDAALHRSPTGSVAAAPMTGIMQQAVEA